MTTAFYTDQTILMLAALIILGIVFILKVITTLTLLIIVVRQKKPISILLGHPCIKKARELMDQTNCLMAYPPLDTSLHPCNNRHPFHN